MKTKTKTTKIVDVAELVDEFNKEDKDSDVIVTSYVSRLFLEPWKFGTTAKHMSTSYVYSSVGEIKNKPHSYADGYIEFGGESSHSTTIYFSAYEPEEIESTLDKVDNLEREVMDFCAKMREALEAYKIVAKVHKEGK